MQILGKEHSKERAEQVQRPGRTEGNHMEGSLVDRVGLIGCCQDFGFYSE